jgi:hypothetical protein
MMKFLAMKCEKCGRMYNAFEVYCPSCGHEPEQAATLFTLYGESWPLEAFYSLAFGDDPNKWSLPEGQPLTWTEWGLALSDQAVTRGWNPEFWPWDEDYLKKGNCWIGDWVTGKTPKETAEKHHDSQIVKN